MTTIATIELIIGCFRVNVQFLQFIYFFDWGAERHSLAPLFALENKWDKWESLGTFRLQRYSKRDTQRQILPDYLEKKHVRGEPMSGGFCPWFLRNSRAGNGKILGRNKSVFSLYISFSWPVIAVLLPLMGLKRLLKCGGVCEENCIFARDIENAEVWANRLLLLFVERWLAAYLRLLLWLHPLKWWLLLMRRSLLPKSKN